MSLRQHPTIPPTPWNASTIRDHCDDALLDHLPLNAQLVKHRPDGVIVQLSIRCIRVIISGFTPFPPSLP